MLIEVEVTGEEPLMLNRFTTEAAMDATHGTRTAHRGEKLSPEDQCRAALYIGTNGHSGKPIVPRNNLLKCLMEGGKFHKLGTTKLTTRDSSLIPAFVRIL